MAQRQEDPGRARAVDIGHHQLLYLYEESYKEFPCQDNNYDRNHLMAGISSRAAQPAPRHEITIKLRSFRFLQTLDSGCEQTC